MTDEERKTENDAPPDPGSIQIARVAGIPIRLHFTFVLLMAFLLLFSHGPSLLSALLILALFGCIVLHELGHSLVARRFGIRVESITVYPIGGLARMVDRPAPRQEVLVSLAGPAVNLVIAALLWAVLTATGHWVGAVAAYKSNGHWFEKLAVANVVLAVFNLVPAFPMDGGRVLRGILAISGMPMVKATSTAATIGRVLAVVAGLIAVKYGNWWVMFISFFVYLGAGEEAAAVRKESAFSGVTIASVMVTDLHTLKPGDTLQNASDLLLSSSQQDFPVVHGDDVVGLLTREGMLRSLAIEGPTGYVAGAMNREFPSVRSDSDVKSLFHGDSPARPGGRLPALVLTDGKLVGMVTGENITEYFAVQQMLEIGRKRLGVDVRR